MGFLPPWLYQIVSEGCLRSVIPRRTFLFIFLRHTLPIFGERPVKVKKWIAGTMVPGQEDCCNRSFLSCYWEFILCSNHPLPMFLKMGVPWLCYDNSNNFSKIPELYFHNRRSYGPRDSSIVQSGRNFRKWRPITRGRRVMSQLGVTARAPGSRLS